MQAGADLELIDASRRGDTAAFAQIIERYHPAVYAVAFSGLRDRALADDITQDTFVAAWGRLGELRDTRKLPAWLCGIARNRARDARKRLRRETIGEPDDVVDPTTPYDVLSEAESERLVAAALGQVPDVYREPLVLYYYEERSVEDVARSLGISPATTNKRLSRGRQFLAERVEMIVERGLNRRALRPALAASVLAIIGVTLPASHVDASPAVPKGSSTMHKLAIAATVLATATAGGLVVASELRGDAHASSRASGTHAGVSPTEANDPWKCQLPTTTRMPTHAGRLTSVPSLPTMFSGKAAANDCSAVGRYLADLEADTTHGPDHRPDEATCEKCANHYSAICESEAWTLPRRICVLNASDLINAHLCAGQTSSAPPAEIPAALSCDTVAAHVTPIAQSSGFYTDVTDLAEQIESACEVGSWSIELRQCLTTGQTFETLKTCIHPDADAAK